LTDRIIMPFICPLRTNLWYQVDRVAFNAAGFVHFWGVWLCSLLRWLALLTSAGVWVNDHLAVAEVWGATVSPQRRVR